ncbi:Eco57I restriction-modification methylase domain-containing protein [Flavobacterium okayamense]|uniref:site-specific DNA-methyltransferase (adenine-specific) n=1 Tax=Flavobacterium okayamense TaxID=2830782 RepID=A0ABN6HZ38_9FLAO|nr:N-6 DNA methylase [Flavobacterium okayamense]BCY28970.1 type II endonuclease-methyltransferasefusion protein [Flavobacterium okayamense]
MPLFQQSVLKKYLAQQDKTEVEKAYKKFTKFFHDAKTQDNIRNSKEEQFQEGFLRELFVNILGYTLNPTPKFNLTTELKNQKGSKKADGAILKDDKALAVIELKGTNTKDLESIRQQAFDYKANQVGCVYVITSNFEKLRFYINNAVDFEEFNLFTLTEKEFELFYLCLAKDQLLNNKPLAIKEASIVEEESITKKFYADYSVFKRELYRDLVKRNMKNDSLRELTEKNIKLALFKKSQKLIDRFLFILFAEDRGLLSPNSILTILNEWKALEELDVQVPLYDRYKQYFGYLDTGRKGTDKKEEVFAYNGGLFQPDAVLDAMVIDDDLLYRHTKKLSAYDFESQVDVNILGHIFEHSLNEIESVNAEIEGTEFDKQKTKRKKDGVFYTPKYITKYIVDNTVGKLCEQKKQELGIVDEEYAKGRKNRQAETIKKLDQKLQEYRNWLLQITICDPACGSGAFLNQALDFLIKEHSFIDELNRQLFGGGFAFPDIENQILEHNIYGVDLNEESVEIAKLSLWLRTAQPKRKLTSLNNNIKCGNSLIESKTVAGDKAFNWQEQFPEVFSNGGFDVIIGNPPYLRVQGLRENFEKESLFYEKKFKSATGRFDVYVLFMEHSYNLINQKGVVSFILPHKFLISDFGVGIRNFFVDKKAVESLIHFGSEMVFADASTYTCIINLSKNNKQFNYKQIKPLEIFDVFDFEIIDYKILSGEKWNLNSQCEQSLIDKINKQPLTIKDVFENISQGVVSVGDDIYLMKGKIIGDKFIGFSDKINQEITLEANIVRPLLKGEDVKKYKCLDANYYCFYPHEEKNGKTIPFEEDNFKSNYPLAYQYILPFKNELIEKKIRYKTNPKAWYSLHRSREISLFEQEKIITPEISLGTNMTLDTKSLFHNTKCYTLAKNKFIKEDNKFWLAILNSKLLWFYLSSTGYVLRGGFFTFKTKYLEPFPLPKIESLEIQKPFIEKVEKIISLNSDFQIINSKFIKYFSGQFHLDKLTKKLENWYELSFADFIKELNKAIKGIGGTPLTKKDEIEWMDLFEDYKKQALDLKAQIDATDKAIDQMVYELYGLTQEEIDIVENS